MHLILIIILEARNINYYNNIHKDKNKKKRYFGRRTDKRGMNKAHVLESYNYGP